MIDCPTSWPRSRPSNFLAGLSVSGAEQWIFIAYLAAGLQFAFEFETQPGPHFFQPDQLRLCRGISSLVILAGCTVEIIRRWQSRWNRFMAVWISEKEFIRKVTVMMVYLNGKVDNLKGVG